MLVTIFYMIYHKDTVHKLLIIVFWDALSTLTFLAGSFLISDACIMYYEKKFTITSHGQKMSGWHFCFLLYFGICHGRIYFSFSPGLPNLN